ncbi:TetR/AcrR family transcriptional regulator [Pseudonocardia hispaniensis]|uniref:TetR/AcrR family transcriptional regulator n=1 Tax=Pseudonocardia hispaniensis TaxID=904933 RepID=A0ABW1J656_9PSEU
MSETSTRDRILDALEQLLAGTGAAQISLESVAARAGVSKGGLLHHFRSKEALLAALVRRFGERADARLAAALRGGTSVANFYLQSYEDSDEESFALFRSALAALRSADGRHTEVQHALTEVMRSWDEGLRREITDPVQAEIVRLVGDGLFLAALLGLPQPEPELHRQVTERLLG